MLRNWGPNSWLHGKADHFRFQSGEDTIITGVNEALTSVHDDGGMAVTADGWDTGVILLQYEDNYAPCRSLLHPWYSTETTPISIEATEAVCMYVLDVLDSLGFC